MGALQFEQIRYFEVNIFSLELKNVLRKLVYFYPPISVEACLLDQPVSEMSYFLLSIL